MKRGLLNFAILISLVLLAFTFWMWWRSMGRFIEDSWNGPRHELKIHSVDGVLGIYFAPDIGLRSRLGFGSGRSEIPAGADRAVFYGRSLSFNRFGFGFYVTETIGPPKGSWRFGGRRLIIAFTPFWLVSLLLCSPSLLWMGQRAHARRRLRKGLCQTCGYDLRATPDRCPECGTKTQNEGGRMKNEKMQPG